MDIVDRLKAEINLAPDYVYVDALLEIELLRNALKHSLLLSDSLRPLRKALERGTIDYGSIAFVRVQHDDKCDARHGRGRECTCEPRMTVNAIGGAIQIQRDGLLCDAKLL